MKRILIIGGLLSLFATCNSDKTAPKETQVASASSEKLNYAYQPMYHEPDYWERGDQKNLVIVLQALKDFENGNIEEALKVFADSVGWASDYFDATVSKDSLRSMLTSFRKPLKSFKIDMDDYEAVTGKDKKAEWVSLWYKQTWTDQNGKTDSTFAMDDVKIVNGKVTYVDEKTRHYPTSKKQ